MNTSLIEKFNSLASELSGAELDNYKLLLNIAAGGLAPHGDPPQSGLKAEAFETVLQCLKHIQPTGLVWYGRPEFMTDELLTQLQEEARQKRTTAKRTDRYYLGCGGTIADELALSAAMVNFVNSYTSGMVPTGIASYLFYDEEGCGVEAHVDTEVFTLNVIIMLRHKYVLTPPSHLVVCPVGQSPQKLLLAPGEVALLYAGGTIHAREDVKAGESISLLTIGFEPAD